MGTEADRGGEDEGRGRTAPVVPAVAVDARGTVVACDPAAARLLGREPADVIGRPLRDLPARR
ncbi:PAS domain-containing protein [Actinacidiphila soli]|uniref:PAS domain-containing protein n=1 Tax=Actinacidiphila soli TaxID=2487275 RepID=UPI000FCCB210